MLSRHRFPSFPVAGAAVDDTTCVHMIVRQQESGNSRDNGVLHQLEPNQVPKEIKLQWTTNRFLLGKECSTPCPSRFGKSLFASYMRAVVSVFFFFFHPVSFKIL